MLNPTKHDAILLKVGRLTQIDPRDEHFLVGPNDQTILQLLLAELQDDYRAWTILPIPPEGSIASRTAAEADDQIVRPSLQG